MKNLAKPKINYPFLILLPFLLFFIWFPNFKPFNREMPEVQAPSKSLIRLQTWNLRFDSQPNGESVQDTISRMERKVPQDNKISYYETSGEVPWSKRRISIANHVVFNGAGIFAVQEALYRQVQDLNELLNLFDSSSWDWIGLGRDDGKLGGEFEAIFYDTERFELIEWDNFWLSKTPFEPSRYPGAGSLRTVTIGLFKFKGEESKNPFIIMNTHYDEQSENQRRLASSLIKYRASYEFERLKNEYGVENPSIILCGDLNSHSFNENSGGYRIITGNQPLETDEISSEFAERFRSANLSKFNFRDLMEETPPQFRFGHLSTFTGFSKIGDTSKFSRIDFQFGATWEEDGKTNHGWKALKYKVDEIFYDNEYPLSDHRPVVTELLL
ncbi:Putative endonuclease/Exonuclease/Phosphatase [Komagataella phaffii]|uniref:Endonuclease/exonuclease/phosphatase domain-containing protein n=2 Tax=Komagataella phaffii TaxID=460519 RepID=C4QW08_KOMPG|nr:Hypothetical protein PAS_chr1-1_0071 [Komagataella phaffii GS115]AOA61408.1 GQ67_02638T0 [Komagataella phaffii]AOA65895.1 GQ68_02610T0 [Komagataella phaffii GS115]CAY67431.1 Hypothetical protein PAS_chr1-1_0071 [Komagataella phaffii GS115]